MQDILDGVDPSFIRSAPNNALAVVLTGGGAELPMVQTLAKGSIISQGFTLRIISNMVRRVLSRVRARLS